MIEASGNQARKPLQILAGKAAEVFRRHPVTTAALAAATAGLIGLALSQRSRPKPDPVRRAF